jgi:hypothetical protein
MHLRICGNFNSARYIFGPQIANPQIATFAGAISRVYDLRNLFADRPPLI